MSNIILTYTNILTQLYDFDKLYSLCVFVKLLYTTFVNEKKEFILQNERILIEFPEFYNLMYINIFNNEDIDVEKTTLNKDISNKDFQKYYSK